MSMKTLLIDGDVLVYQSCTVVEQEFDWGDDIWSLVSDARAAKQIVDTQIQVYKATLNADRVIMTLSGDTNWRKDLLPSYKANRKNTRKPLAFKAVRDYVLEVYNGICVDNLEGDDVLGLLAGGWKKIKGDKIVVSIDKDMLTVPGLHYNPMRPAQGVIGITKDMADYNHMFQTLIGDRVDGYFGCPGVGEVKAKKILENTEDTWGAVVKAYEKAGLTESDALIQARVSRILRHGEYNHKSKKVQHWTPEEATA
jgi:DNA polymerase-1